MTFSLAARDPRTGAFGMVLSSSSPAVAARCLHLRAGAGAAASQNVTNPRLGSFMLDALAHGASASTAIQIAVTYDRSSAYRQLTAVDDRGGTAHFSGARTLGLHAVAEGDQAVAAGNLLARESVVTSMLEGYARSGSPTFEERLLDGLVAAVDDGGEAGPVRSAGLAVVETAPWPVTDLRVDDSDDPVEELARLLGLWIPQKHDYLTRALDPEEATPYGVPGDL